MPSPPEFSDVPTEIGNFEIRLEHEAEQLGRSNRHVGITREISVNLKGEQDGGQEQGATGLCRKGIEYPVHIDSAVVRHHHLLEQAP